MLRLLHQHVQPNTQVGGDHVHQAEPGYYAVLVDGDLGCWGRVLGWGVRVGCWSGVLEWGVGVG